MNIIICGSTGYIGSRLYTHISTYLKPGDNLFGYNRDGFHSHQNQSLSDEDIVKAINKHNHNILVYSISTQVPGLNSFSTPESIYTEYNTLESILTRICDSISVSYIFLMSSAGAFAYQEKVKSPSVISEVTSHQITSSYSLTTKLKEDLLVSFSASYGIPISILRLSNVFGPPFIADRPQGLINKLIINSSNRDPIILNVSLKSKKNVLFVDDVCSIILRLLDLYLARVPIPTILLVSSPHHISISEIVATVNLSLEKQSKSIPLINFNFPDFSGTIQTNPTFDNTLLQQTLVDFAFTSFSVAIEQSISEYYQ